MVVRLLHLPELILETVTAVSGLLRAVHHPRAHPHRDLLLVAAEPCRLSVPTFTVASVCRVIYGERILSLRSASFRQQRYLPTTVTRCAGLSKLQRRPNGLRKLSLKAKEHPNEIQRSEIQNGSHGSLAARQPYNPHNWVSSAL